VAEKTAPGRHLFVTKGAFSNVLEICTTRDRDGTEVSLYDAARAELEAIFRAKGDQGFRVLALATRRVASESDYDREDEQDMVFRGFLVFLDPPKPEARTTIEDLSRLGIAIKVISGDNRNVTAHMAEAVGLDAKSMLTGEELARLKDEALWHLAPETDLFVEIGPQQKEMSVRLASDLRARSICCGANSPLCGIREFFKKVMGNAESGIQIQQGEVE
jgi:Mg2+-importing ATPase